jgi:hypothetical protein
MPIRVADHRAVYFTKHHSKLFLPYWLAAVSALTILLNVCHLCHFCQVRVLWSEDVRERVDATDWANSYYGGALATIDRDPTLRGTAASTENDSSR